MPNYKLHVNLSKFIGEQVGCNQHIIFGYPWDSTQPANIQEYNGNITSQTL